MSKKIIVAGHICLDITPVFSQTKMSDIAQVFVPGSLLSMKGVSIHTGGIVSNTGMGLKKLGADVCLMGKVGQDDFGAIVMKKLKEMNIDDGMIVSENENTSYSVVLAPPSIDRIFLHDPGANDTFGYEDIDFHKIEDAAVFHFGYPPIMKKMYEQDGAELIRIFKRVKEMGVATSLDLAAVDENSDAGKADWYKILSKVLPYVDFFMPSLEELAFMMDREFYHALRKRAGNQDMTLFVKQEEVEVLAQKMLDLGSKVVLIKCGAKGMYLKTASSEILSQISKEIMNDPEGFGNRAQFEKSFVPDQVLSATGAGDTSCGAFLYAMTEGYSLEICLKLAMATGASCVSAYDAISGLQPFSVLLEKIEQGWEKQNISK